MLPILLYNNMDGGSNSENNSTGSNYVNVYDENIILNSVRSRKKVSETVSCPVCSCTIRSGELESHLQHEIERIQKISCPNKRKLSTTNLSASFAMPGSSAAMDESVEPDIDVSGCTGSETYRLVHSNRLKRLRARRRATSPLAQTGECPVCNMMLPVSRLQRHALRCLKRTGANVDEDVPDSSSEDGSIDVENDEPLDRGFGAEYEWCGETRVRATALQERTRESNSSRQDSDQALIVDGDEDTELYGPPQYSPSRIAQDAVIASEESGTDEPMPNGAAHAQELEPYISNPTLQSPHKHNGLVEASAETRIQALKARIKDLERKHNSASEAKCLICLGSYSSAAVSIQCWHVYCEACWLQSLKAKKICPQCNAITTTEHLRRIYM